MSVSATAQARPELAGILFVDAVDSVATSRILGTVAYDRFLDELQVCYRDILHVHRLARTPAGEVTQHGADQLGWSAGPGVDSWWSIRGDELMVVLRHPQGKHSQALYRLIWLAMELKLIWWQRPFNKEQLEDHGEVVEMGVGLHLGPVVVKPRPWRLPEWIEGKAGPDGITAFAEKATTVEGYGINVGKRIEAASRMGRHSMLMASREAWNTLAEDADLNDKLLWGPPLSDLPKGLGPTDVFEMYAYAPNEELIVSHNVDLLVEILRRKPYDIAMHMALLDADAAVSGKVVSLLRKVHQVYPADQQHRVKEFVDRVAPKWRQRSPQD